MEKKNFLNRLGKRQRESIESIYEIMVKEKAVEAIYLKGSIARGDSDEYSDVDFYCLINDTLYEDFLEKRVRLLQNYRPIIYHSESNFVCPQIVAVFDNGLHFDLYSEKNISSSNDSIKVLYDPKDLLSNYETAKKNNKSKQVAERINSFSFTLLEFEAAYKREDYLWATRLGHHLVGDMSIVLSYIYDKDKHYLGLKRLHKNLEDITLRKYSKIVDMIKLSTILTGIFELMNFLDQQLKVLPNEVLENTNIEFFNFMVKRISSIDLKNKMGSN